MEFAVRHGQGIANPIAGEYDNYALIEFSRSRPDSGMRADMETMLEQAFEEGLIQDATVAQSDAQRAAFWLIRETVVERSEEHTSELQSLMRNSYAVFCLKKKTNNKTLSR